MEAAMTKDLKNMVRNCDFCESSLDQIKKSLLVYLSKKAEAKHTHHMSTMLKNVGSTETNPNMQDTLFKCSEAYAELDLLLSNYIECGTQQKLLLDEAKKLLIAPIRETVSDCNNALKKKGVQKTKTNHESRTATTTTTTAAVTTDDCEINQRVLHQANILPHHSEMFEKHRLIYMKGILKSVLFAEMQYHCQVIEKLSPLFESLALVDENEALDVESYIRMYQMEAFSS